MLLILHHAITTPRRLTTGNLTVTVRYRARAQPTPPLCNININNSNIQSGVCNFIRLTVIGGSMKLKSGLTGSITSSRSFKTSPFSSTWELGLSPVKHLGTLWSPYLTGTTCDISKMTSVLAAVAVVFLWNVVCLMFPVSICVPALPLMSWTVGSRVSFFHRTKHINNERCEVQCGFRGKKW